MNEQPPRWTPTELALAEAKLHRKKVMRIVALNSKWIDTLVEEAPDTLPIIKLSKENK